MKDKIFLKLALSVLLVALTSCSSVSLKNWSVRILSPGYCPGRHIDYFVVIPITLKNIGKVSKSPSLDLEFSIVDSDGTFYDNLLPNSSAPDYDFYKKLTIKLEPDLDFNRDLIFNDILPSKEVNILIGFWLQNKAMFDAHTIRLRMQERDWNQWSLGGVPVVAEKTIELPDIQELECPFESSNPIYPEQYFELVWERMLGGYARKGIGGEGGDSSVKGVGDPDFISYGKDNTINYLGKFGVSFLFATYHGENGTEMINPLLVQEMAEQTGYTTDYLTSNWLQAWRNRNFALEIIQNSPKPVRDSTIQILQKANELIDNDPSPETSQDRRDELIKWIRQNFSELGY